MAPPNPKSQKSARNKLGELFTHPANVYVIHYSCEDFRKLKGIRSPRITSIALRNLDSAQTSSFSIHQVAEVQGVTPGDIADRYDEFEKEMLQNFFDRIARLTNITYLHWNMRDSHFGFQAIEHRFRTLGGSLETDQIVEDRDKLDLSRLLIDIYGSSYASHPRWEKLITKEGKEQLPPDFLPGAKEAEAFDEQQYVALHRSTLRKVDVLANLALLAHERNLKTNANWWDMHGASITSWVKWLGDHPFSGLLFGLASLIALGITIGSSCR